EAQIPAGLTGVNVLIKELTEGRKELSFAHSVLETFGGALGGQVRVPNHGRGKQRVGHLAHREVQPIRCSPADINLAKREAGGGFAERTLVRGAARGG